MDIRLINELDDKIAISNVYAKSWKNAYKEILPDSYLCNISKEKWVPFLERDDVFSLIMIINKKVIGTIAFGAGRDSAHSCYGEIISLYLLPEYTGHGYGKLLLTAAVNRLSEMGYKDIYLWVAEKNFKARNFYEKNGFVATDKVIEQKIGQIFINEIQYIFSII